LRSSRTHVDHDLGLTSAGRRRQRQAGNSGPHLLGEHGRDLRQHVGRGPAELGVGPALDDARADQERVQLVLGEHQRRQVETVPEQVADAGRPLDRHALADQLGDVAIDGSDGTSSSAASTWAVTARCPRRSI
jgi:hypothetical protein